MKVLSFLTKTLSLFMETLSFPLRKLRNRREGPLPKNVKGQLPLKGLPALPLFLSQPLSSFGEKAQGIALEGKLPLPDFKSRSHRSPLPPDFQKS